TGAMSPWHPPLYASSASRTGKQCLQLLLDARGLARQFAQVIELRPAHIATALHLDAVDRGTVGLEYALDALAVGHLANGKGGVETPVTLGDHHAFKGLKTLAVAFFHLDLHDDR